MLRGSHPERSVDTTLQWLLVLLKTIVARLSLAICLFGVTECLAKKSPVPTKQATSSLFQIKSYNSLLRILLCMFVAI